MSENQETIPETLARNKVRNDGAPGDRRSPGE